MKSVLALFTGTLGEGGAAGVVSAKAGAANVTAAIKRKTLICISWRIILRDQTSLLPNQIKMICDPAQDENHYREASRTKRQVKGHFGPDLVRLTSCVWE